jgi:uncharacterized protein YbjT (DUF2867 family)
MSRISVLGGTGYAGSAVVGEAVPRPSGDIVQPARADEHYSVVWITSSGRCSTQRCSKPR